MIIFPRSGCFWSDWTFFGWTKVKEKRKKKERKKKEKRKKKERKNFSASSRKSN
jgi:hypothetical protein